MDKYFGLSEQLQKVIKIIEAYNFKYIPKSSSGNKNETILMPNGKKYKTSTKYISRFYHQEFDGILNLSNADKECGSEEVYYLALNERYLPLLKCFLPDNNWEARSKNSNLADCGSGKNKNGLKMVVGPNSKPDIEKLRIVLQAICNAFNLKFDIELVNTAIALYHNNPNSDEVLVKEIKSLLDNKKITEIEKEVIVKQRIGQSSYRNRLLALWGNKCSVTGCDNQDFLIASHIKAWSECRNHAKDCIDSYNGLLLIPNLDKAFDKSLYLISFDDDGKIIISKTLKNNPKLMNILGIHQDMKLRIALTDEQKTFLVYHRDQFFEKEKER